MSFYIDPTDRQLKAKIDALNSNPGFCFFIDIVGSTELKDKSLSKWVLFIYNTFANVRSNLYMLSNPLKSLGDALMSFLPETNLHGESALSLFASFWDTVDSNEPYLKKVKIGAAYCRCAYDITFIQNAPDIYGKDIDLTARLLSVAGAQEIVMNEEFVKRIRADYDAIGNKDRFAEVLRIVGPWLQQLKGFKNLIPIFKIVK